MDSPTGIQALAGRLRLRIVGGEAWFEVARPGGEDMHFLTAVVGPPAATIGCGADADHRLGGSSTRGMSRRHLVVQPAGRQWTVLDCSKNGTREVVAGKGGREWRRLTRDFPIPVAAGMRLALGAGLELKLELIQPAGPGSTTVTEDEFLAPSGERVPTFELERIARALLAPRQAGVQTIPAVTGLAEDLDMSRQDLHRKITALGDLPEVKPLLEGKARTRQGRRSQDIADALAIAFPYLTAPGPAG
jgi:hypothetical protein